MLGVDRQRRGEARPERTEAAHLDVEVEGQAHPSRGHGGQVCYALKGVRVDTVDVPDARGKERRLECTLEWLTQPGVDAVDSMDACTNGTRPIVGIGI